MGPLIITFENNSDQDFTLSSSYTTGEDVFGFSSFSTYPDEILKAQTGFETLELDENFMSNLINSSFNYLSLGWKHHKHNLHFGIKISVPTQVLGIGDRPYYSYAYGNEGSPEWHKAHSDPDKPYTFPPEDVGFDIHCDTKSTHTSLKVSAIIKNL
ncbi:hypothetical protein [Labrenzia sp. PHM005]|uniref:hypothetical protein n=1 Tax=Labrenzia sp. PHM005 TaxID=2590016 RepID=UPI0011408A3E|nr:hypothetical protein [Labrenzia sp. PHM005]QDG77987.1 hypothetical protein FJ695_20175 [Labrenzia sp. PHM005]